MCLMLYLNKCLRGPAFTGGHQVPCLFCFFFHVPSETSLPGVGTLGCRRAHRSQIWELATWTLNGSRSSCPRVPCWVIFFPTSINRHLNSPCSFHSQLGLGFGWKDQTSFPLSDGTLDSHPPPPQTLLSSGLGFWAECLFEMGFEGAGQPGGLAKGSVRTFRVLEPAEIGLL